MSCNETNTSNSGSNNEVPVVKGVYGNVLRLAIPLTKRVVTMENDEVVATDTNFTPSSEYPVTVQFVKDAIKIDMPATMMNGYIAFIEDKGTLPVGTYALVVLCKDEEGNPYRFKQRTVVRIFDVTADADIQQPIEFESRVWYLDAAIFLALKGEDGVGIEETIIEQSDEVGGYNYITFVMTDGTSQTFSVMNGSGSVDTIFSTTSQHPLANSVVTQRFNTVEQSISDANGDISDLQENAVCSVEYDTTTNHLIGHTLDVEHESQPRFSIDFSEFLKNYFIDGAKIQNGYLKLSYNADANKPDLSVNLNDHINPSDYFTSAQVIQRFASIDDLSAYLRLNAAGKINYAHSPFIILTSLNFQYNGNPTASLVNNAYFCTDGYVRYFYSDGNSINSIRATPVSGILYCLKSTGDLYRWDAPTLTFMLTNRHFNSADYYTKAQVNEIVVDFATETELEDLIAYVQSSFANIWGDDGRLPYDKAPAIILYGFDEEAIGAGDGDYIYVSVQNKIQLIQDFVSPGGGNARRMVDIGEPDENIVYFNKTRQKFYRYTSTSGWVEIETGSGSGGSFTQVQADWNESDTTDPAYINNKPTIPVVPTNVSSFTNDAGYLTQHQDISGKAEKSEMSVTAGTGNDADKTTIQLKSGTSATVLTSHQSLSGKQDVLVSGTNIKTINGTSVLGSGDIDTVQVIFGKYVAGSNELERGAFYRAAFIFHGNWTFENEPLALEGNIIYVDVLTNKCYRLNGLELQEICAITIDTSITNGGTNAVTGGAIYAALAGKQDTLTFDNVPTASSDNPVKSGGVKTALDGKADVVTKIQVSGNTPSQAMVSGVFYEFTGSLTSLTLTLTSPSNGTGVYAGKFTSDSTTATTLSLPQTVTEASGNPTIATGKTYEFNIVDNVLLVIEL